MLLDSLDSTTCLFGFVVLNNQPKEVKGISTQAFVDNWVSQQNYPKISITLEKLAQNSSADFKKMYIKQEQFLSYSLYDEQNDGQGKQSPAILK